MLIHLTNSDAICDDTIMSKQEIEKVKKFCFFEILFLWMRRTLASGAWRNISAEGRWLGSGHRHIDTVSAISPEKTGGTGFVRFPSQRYNATHTHTKIKKIKRSDVI
jgi:hypothetical protein